jgi:hypothetical protein
MTNEPLTTTTEMPSASVQVMRTGTALSPDVAQFLASEIATAASRERERRTTISVLGGAVFVGVGVTLVFFDERAPGFLAAALALSFVLFVGLAWGVRNRALLDRSAHDAAIAPRVLVHAVRLVRGGAGPSTALREALENEAAATTHAR